MGGVAMVFAGPVIGYAVGAVGARISLRRRGYFGSHPEVIGYWGCTGAAAGLCVAFVAALAWEVAL